MTETFVLSAEQLALRGAVRSYCARPSGTDAVTDLGLAGLAIDERDGGSGGGAVDLGLVAEEFGRALVPNSWLASTGMGATALQGCRDDVARRVLAQIAAGATSAAVAITDATGRLNLAHPPLAMGAGGLTGACGFVLGGATADVFVCSGCTAMGRPSLYLVAADAAGVTRRPVSGMDPACNLADVTLSDVAAHEIAASAAAVAAVQAALDIGAAMLAAEQVGVAEAMLAAAVDHARSRIQFGRPIGSFQAVKHRCVDMYLQVEGARSCAYHALWALDTGADDCGLAASLAQLVCNSAARAVTAAAIQVFGGVGFTWEHPAHRYLKRAVSNGALLGGSEWYANRVADRILPDVVLAAGP